jgi:hypothetical protein
VTIRKSAAANLNERIIDDVLIEVGIRNGKSACDREPCATGGLRATWTMRGFGRCEGSLLVDAVNGNHLTRRRNPVNLAAVDQAIAPGVLALILPNRYGMSRIGPAQRYRANAPVENAATTAIRARERVRFMGEILLVMGR